MLWLLSWRVQTMAERASFIALIAGLLGAGLWVVSVAADAAVKGIPLP